MKHCNKCNTDKELTEFYFDKSRSAYVAPCKKCRIATVRISDDKWRKENKVRYRTAEAIRKVFKKYGLTQEQLVEMWQAQDKACAICHKPISLSATAKASKPHIDHCHVSGVVRGLLCLTCNTGLGMFGDSADLLDAAKHYLQSRGASTIKGDVVTASVNADSKETSITIH